MKKFFRNRHGAVTVIVTLLLVPSLLITGTAVDVTRVYASRSILADANSLAANSALASYDALLQDLYALYGIQDEVLQGMVDEYIQLAVFGENNPTGMGTFQLFYGSESSLSSEVTPSGYSLNKTEVLRRQIEEYMKLRAPVVIVERIMSILESVKKVNQDAVVINSKLAIDKGMDEIQKNYKEIYDLIGKMDGYQSEFDNVVSNINFDLNQINNLFNSLLLRRRDWGTAYEAGNSEKKAEAREWYSLLIGNISCWATGGQLRNNLILKDYDSGNDNFKDVEVEDGYLVADSGSLSGQVRRGNKAVKDYGTARENLVKKLEATENKKQALKLQLETLKVQLNTCSEDLQEGMTKKSEETGKSLLDTYEDMLAYDLRTMANAVSSVNSTKLQEFSTWLENVGYGNRVKNGVGIKDEEVINYGRLGQWVQEKYEEEFSIHFLTDYELKEGQEKDGHKDVLKPYAGLSASNYSFPKVELTRFEDINSETKAFYNVLKKICNASGSDSEEDKYRGQMKQMLEQIEAIMKGLTNEPEGAYYYEASDEEEEGAFNGADSLGTDEDAIVGKMQSQLSSSFLSQMGNLADDAVDKILLVTYDVEMFSNYSTNKPKDSGKDEKSLTQIPYGIDVNYFYQSEQEFLFHGSDNAKSNLNAVTGYIFLIRFICNYIVSFTIPEIQQWVDLVVSAVPVPILNVVLGETLRLVVALAQTAIDVANLRNGKHVPFMHNKSDWDVTMEGFERLAEKIATGEINKDNDPGLVYADYMTVFLLFINGEDLAERTQRLIEMNLTNYKHKSELTSLSNNGDREEKMASFSLENLGKYQTGFSIKSSAEMDMIFLSMPLAQKGVNGVKPNSTYTIQETVYRGY